MSGSSSDSTELAERQRFSIGLPGDDFKYKPVGAEIPYEELYLGQPWEQFNIEHELTRKGIQKFVADYKATLRKAS